MIAYISIGNSDDKLTQAEWAEFQRETASILHGVELMSDGRIHGTWVSLPTDPWQNACWCIDLRTYDPDLLKKRLQILAAKYRQNCIAWAEVNATEFLAANHD